MTIIEKQLGKYKVTVDSDMGDGATGCWIEYGRDSVSLECLLAEGEIGGIKVSQSDISAIENFAEENGY